MQVRLNGREVDETRSELVNVEFGDGAEYIRKGESGIVRSALATPGRCSGTKRACPIDGVVPVGYEADR